MSLFPAYVSLPECDELLEDKNKLLIESEDRTWLTNSSFDHGVDSAESSAAQHKASTNYVDKNSTLTFKKKKSKSHKKSREKYSSCNSSADDSLLQHRLQKDDNFYLDKKSEKGNFSVPTLYRPAIPKYHLKCALALGTDLSSFETNKRKKNPLKSRYFMVLKSSNDNDKIFSPELSKSNKDNDESISHAVQLEANFSKTTGDFNRELAEQPHNVNLWMEYIQFQDSVLLFQKTYHRSENGERITAERKLDILDKAIKLNPLSDMLIKERFKIAETVFTNDQLAEDALRHLDKDPSSLILWHSLINSTRNSMTRCTVPSVLQTFTRAIVRLHQLCRGASKDFIQNVEENILVLVLECGLFLQQAGLWEQLWTLLKLYLTLNLSMSEPNHFKIEVTVPEKQLLEEEDVVINSGLPLPTLWVRVEHLRSSVHFLPVNSSDDPQRIVFTDDLASLLQPITSSNLSFLLVISTITLLKVPVLPTRHSTLEMLSFLDIPSCINTIESLLATVYPIGPVLQLQYDYLSDAVNLSIEPQFVRGKFGCTEFLTWIVSVMKTCGDHLPNQEGVIIHCWVLRFFRLLLCLEKTKLTTLPNFLSKQSKSYAKELLKQPQFRDCLQLYIEYALVERDLGNLPGACRILETAAKLRQNIPETERSVISALYHTLIDTMLQDPQLDKNKAISALGSLIEMQPLTMDTRSPVEVKKFLNKSHHISTEIITQAVSKSLDKPALCDCFVPHLCVEWTANHAWLLYLTQSVWAGTSYIEEVMEKLSSSANTIGYIWREQLWEVMVSMLHYHVLHNASGYTVLRTTLQRGVKEYPNNLHLLNTIAILETSSDCGSLWWKLVSVFPVDSTLARLTLIFIARSKLKHRSSGDSDLDCSSENRLYNLLKQCTLNPVTKKCPLIWRLYLQFVASKEDKLTIKNTFYKALEECPWVKCLYFEAAQLLPEELPEIQDLLIEKELRLHTTPEELEVLRVEERPDRN